MNPLAGIKRMFGLQGLIELAKSIVKVGLLGGVGPGCFFSQVPQLIGLARADTRAAIGNVGGTFIVAVLVMAGCSH